jgi:hypothetical protein
MKRIYKLTGNEANLTNDTQELQGYTVSKSIEISHTRDGGQDLSIEVDDEEIAELQFDDQTFWMGRAGELPKLFGNDLEKRGSVASVITIPAFINSGNQERGFLKNVLIKAIKFFSPTSTVTEIVMKESAQLVDAYLQPNPGLYFLDSNFNKIPVTRQLEASDQPYLLFIHGTASSIHGSFHKMMETRQHGLWNNIVKTYGNRVLALDHYTLSVSPFENATEIAKWLPNNVKLHIISASRGGLVGEVISRYSSSNTSIGFTEIGKKSIMKAFGEESILNFEAALKGKKIIVEKFIRVACPGAGTTLLSERLDLFLNVVLILFLRLLQRG